MIKEKIDALFSALGCNNSDIARFADCNPSHISRIRSGKRDLSQGSASVSLLARGLYLFCEENNELKTLSDVCQIPVSSREVMTVRLQKWFFDETGLVGDFKSPKASTRKKAAVYFGDKLNAVMTLLSISNARLARQVHVDDSHISRFRNGVRTPLSNPVLKQSLASFLFEKATELQMLGELADLLHTGPENLRSENGLAYFSKWLFSEKNEENTEIVDRMLSSIDAVTFENMARMARFPINIEDYPVPDREPLYWGNEGFRQVVLRFLTMSARECITELWLYSDQSLDWLTEDPVFQKRWQVLIAHMP